MEFTLIAPSVTAALPALTVTAPPTCATAPCPTPVADIVGVPDMAMAPPFSKIVAPLLLAALLEELMSPRSVTPPAPAAIVIEPPRPLTPSVFTMPSVEAPAPPVILIVPPIPAPVPLALIALVAGARIWFALILIVPPFPPTPLPAEALIGLTLTATLKVRPTVGAVTFMVPPVPVVPAFAERVPIVLSAGTPPIVVAVVMPVRSTRPPLPATAPLAWMLPTPAVVLAIVSLM